MSRKVESAGIPKSLTMRDPGTLKVFANPFPHKAVFICRFCGGKKCKWEDYTQNPKSAIKGLNCDWITDNILATQRPSSRLIKEYNLAEEFRKNNIYSIYNLEEPGEHPFCGDGILDQSGFSYLPEDFYEYGIYFYNFGWKDMTSTSVDAIFKILKQMALSFKEGKKVAVHCHAGRGRTGMIIAAWLIFCEHYTAKAAISLFKSRREKSLTKKSQTDALYLLEKALTNAKFMFYKTPKYSIADYLIIQKKMLQIDLKTKNRYMPIMVHMILKRLQMCVKRGIFTSKMIVSSFFNLTDTKLFKKDWSSADEKIITETKTKINLGLLELSHIEDPRILVQLMLDFLDGLIKPVLYSSIINEIKEYAETDEKFNTFIEGERVGAFHFNEYFIMERFVRWFAKLHKMNELSDNELQQALTRLGISFLLKRKKLDQNFAKRNLISTKTKDPFIENLTNFLFKWVIQYQKIHMDAFVQSRSPIKINHQRINRLVDSSEENTNQIKMFSFSPVVSGSTTPMSGPQHVRHSSDITRFVPKQEEEDKNNTASSFKLKLEQSNKSFTMANDIRKRDDELTDRIKEPEKQKNFKIMVEDFIEMSASVQDMVIEQLREIRANTNPEKEIRENQSPTLES